MRRYKTYLTLMHRGVRCFSKKYQIKMRNLDDRNRIGFLIAFLLMLLIISVSACGLFRFKGNEVLYDWTKIEGMDNESIMALKILNNERIVAGTFKDGIFFKPSEGTWQQSNLKGVQVRDICLHPDGKLFAATFGEGIWMSEDNGESWTQATPGPDSRGRLVSLAITPTGRILAGVFGSDDFSGEKDIYYSDDLGSTWIGTNLKDAFAIWSLATDEWEYGSRYSGTMQIIYKSSDNGKTWVTKEIPEKIKGEEWMGIAVTKKGTVLAGGDGIIRSTDEGDSWELVLNSYTSIVTIINVDNKQFAGSSRGTLDGQGAGVFRSDDDGQTWGTINNGLTNTEVLSLTHHGDKLYAGTSGGIFVSHLR